MKFRVYGTATIGITITVEAEDIEEAIDNAHDEFNGLRSYVGNGGRDKLIGVQESNVSIDPGDDFEFTDADPLT